MDFTSSTLLLAIGQIILIDIVLSGDNAVVIALACRNLAPAQRKAGILWGVAGAVCLRVILTASIALVMQQPWLKFSGAILLLWIAVKLVLPEDDAAHDITPSAHLWGAVKTIVLADFIMSLDNVIGVAGAARGNLWLLLFGLLVSIPLIVWSSQLIMRAMLRWPLIIVLGAGLLGYVAGEMLLTDPGLLALIPPVPDWTHQLAGVCGAVLVVVLGQSLTRRKCAGAKLENN